MALTNHGYSIPAQSYDLCPRHAQFNNIDFRMSHTDIVSTKLNQPWGRFSENLDVLILLHGELRGTKKETDRHKDI